MRPRDGQGDEAGSVDPRFTRKRLLQGAAGTGVALGAAGFLAACGGGDEETAAPPPAETGGAAPSPAPAPPSPAPGEPVLGGRLRVGHVGGGDAESFNPARGSGFIDASRYYNVFDPLTRVNPDFSTSPGLALEWIPNDDSTLWTIKLRPDVVWHDGKNFTADDVLWTLRQMGKESHLAHTSVTNVVLKDMKKIDDLTVEVPLKSSNARFFESFLQQTTVIVPNEQTDFTKPIGTGPFMFESFTPGERSLCLKNPNYWDEGKPYVDEWEEISIDDPAARVNALLAGEIDMMSSLPFAQAKVYKESDEIQVIDAPSPAIQVFTMATDIPPFDDERVRQAFRLIIDRQALIDGAIVGFGTVGNDLYGKDLAYFADLPVREQDLEQAKALLKAAGKENLTVTLHTSDVAPGLVEAATLFAEQAKGAGVNVKVKKEDPGAYWDVSALYIKMDFAQSFWTPSAASIGLWYEQALLSDATWNETHWRDPAFDKLVRDAQGAPDQETAQELWNEIQQIQYDKGGYIIWANQNIVDAAGNHVKGVVPSAFFNLGGFAYREVWLET